MKSLWKYFTSKRIGCSVKMKVFKMVQRHYAVLGISPPPNQSIYKFPIDGRVFCGFFLFGCLFLSQIVYIVHVADGFMEYMKCACETSTTVIISICFAAIVCRRTLLFQSLDNCRKLMDTSTSHF